jgi:hypothetical protein
MNEICEKCFLDPSSHSFKLIRESKNFCIFYTCVSQAKLYNDVEGIINHYKNLLEKNKNKYWIWIFDCKDLELKHIMNINIPILLTKMIKNHYISKLKKIIIINKKKYIEFILKIVLSFLDEKEKKLIKIY